MEEVLLSKFKFQEVTNLVSTEIWTDIKDAESIEKAFDIMLTKFIRKHSAVFFQYKFSTAVEAASGKVSKPFLYI